MALVTCGVIREGRKRSSKFAWKAPVGRWRGAETEALRVCRLLSLPSPESNLPGSYSSRWASQRDGSQQPALVVMPCSVLLPGAGQYGNCEENPATPGIPPRETRALSGQACWDPGRHLSQSPAITLSVRSY